MAVCLSAAACSAVRWCIPASEIAILAQQDVIKGIESVVNFDVLLIVVKVLLHSKSLMHSVTMRL